MTAWTGRFSERMAHVRASEIRELLKLLDQPDILSFAGGIPDPVLFPTERIAALYAEVLAEAGAQALQYSVSEGLPELRRWIAARMTADGTPCDEGNIVITAGSQQALDLIGKLFLSRGSTVMVERPTYMGALGAFNAYEPAYADLAGEIPAGARLAYVVPDFANPSGRTMPRRERERLLERADAYDLVVIEDGAYRDLRFAGTAEPSLIALDVARSGGIENARTLYCGTFSKTLSPALRLGWVCAPRAVIDKLVLLKQGCDLHVSTINQMVAARVVAEGYEAHLERLRDHYRERASAMQTALARHMPMGVTWSKPQGGMFVWLQLPEGLDGAQLLEAALAEERVAFVPGAPFFAVGAEPNTLRLSYSLPSPAEIDEGVRRLGRLIEGRLAYAGSNAARAATGRA
ncbi:MAG: GntR family transcriptional regulator [Phenylobacterium sp. RIFCSPHIGHO2_01_FULL_69_31]|uniref:aminotransferase-like domain-containing protein n=1 Tax=Phenylobacterium sp. RIFCSPHIGHO2_01_FULL_69_31 TaxID=1801944 RepID=UPI0008AF574E|nr:PLP-dependent aminotransferase family protein [Phenylobacterium sp. RIFCSPHIGHO2_01_FULL_69_31]OHB30196.1 MAG: GntR family transcriptional regulator [Phenylobacterium sp. RIFCSPHIGHO2_01_FULL_69_31]